MREGARKDRKGNASLLGGLALVASLFSSLLRRGWGTCRVWRPQEPRGRLVFALGPALCSSREFHLYLCMIRDHTVQEILKWNVAASLWWTCMPMYWSEILSKMSRTAENVGGRSILKASVVSTQACIALGAVSWTWFKLMWQVGQFLRSFPAQHILPFSLWIDQIESRQRGVFWFFGVFFCFLNASLLVSFWFCPLGFVCFEASSLSSLRLRFLIYSKRLVNVLWFSFLECSRCTKHFSAVPTALWARPCHDYLFTNELLEAQRGQVLTQGQVDSECGAGTQNCWLTSRPTLSVAVLSREKNQIPLWEGLLCKRPTDSGLRAAALCNADSDGREDLEKPVFYH